jgi:hypothetical protein
VESELTSNPRHVQKPEALKSESAVLILISRLGATVRHR